MQPPLPTVLTWEKKRLIADFILSHSLQQLLNVHPAIVCHLILFSSADTAQWADFFFFLHHTFLNNSLIFLLSTLHTLSHRRWVDELKRSLLHFSYVSIGFNISAADPSFQGLTVSHDPAHSRVCHAFLMHIKRRSCPLFPTVSKVIILTVLKQVNFPLTKEHGVAQSTDHNINTQPKL